jgi:hypothetical protein
MFYIFFSSAGHPKKGNNSQRIVLKIDLAAPDWSGTTMQVQISGMSGCWRHPAEWTFMLSDSLQLENPNRLHPWSGPPHWIELIRP